MIPCVPLVEGEADLARFAAPRLDLGADIANLPDKRVHIAGACEESGQVAVLTGIVLVQREIVDIGIARFEHRALPCAEGRHGVVRAAACDKLDRGIEPLHDLGRFAGGFCVCFGALAADLP